jgi:hypothetical protein
MRFDPLSTQIFKYYIPQDINGVRTTSVELKLEPENFYSPLEFYMSFDNIFYIIEEEPAPHVTRNGVAIKFGQQDANWCVNCFIYLIANIKDDQRYYVTSQARQINDALVKLISTNVMVNPFQQECFQYFVLGSKNDVRFEFFSYTGQFDTYITARDLPANPSSKNVFLRSSHGPSQTLYMNS